MEQFEVENGVLKKYRGNEKTVCLPEGIIVIGRNAFTDTSVQEVTIPEGVEIIDSYAFAGASDLQRITFPSSLKQIGFWAFGNCKRLATDYLRYNDSVDVDRTAFNGCCKRTFNSHNYEVQYRIYNELHDDSLQIELYDDDTLLDVLDSYVDDFISDAFQSVIEESLAQGKASMNAQGIYEIYEVAADIYLAAESYLDRIASEMSLSIIDDFSNADDPTAISINVIEKLKAKLEERQTCESWDTDVGWAISGDAMEFQTEGVWQFGLCSKDLLLTDPKEWPQPQYTEGSISWTIGNEELTPMLWFGHMGEPPMQRWVITPHISPDSYHLWFLEDDEEIMNSIVDDFNPSLATWYLAECGMDVPDFSEILDRCPIHFDKGDDENTVREKIASFFLATQKGSALNPSAAGTSDDGLVGLKETGEYKKQWSAHNTKYFIFACSTTVYEGDVKRILTITAEGKDEHLQSPDQRRYVARTVLDISSPRNSRLSHYVVAGIPEDGSDIVTYEELGKWASIAKKLHNELLELVCRVVGNDPYARSPELICALKKALNTEKLDVLLQN